MKKLFLSFVVVFLLCFSVTGVSYSADENTLPQEQVERFKYEGKWVPNLLGIYVEPKIGGTVFMGEYLQREGRSGSATDSAASFGGGLAVGYDFWYKTGLPIRVEAEYMARTNGNLEASGKSFRAQAPQTIFGNAYFDFHNDTKFTPYIGGGIGAAFVGPENSFAWNAGTGVAYEITDNLKATLGYRFVSFGKVEDNHCKGLLYGHEALLGLRYTF